MFPANDAESQHADGAAALAYREYGTGPALVILHGLLGSGTNWRSVARRLAGRHRIVLLDQRNHGASPHRPTMSYRDLAADVVTFLDHHRLGRVTLLGHSMGGKVAMMLALMHPRRVAGLIVVDIAPRRYPSEHAATFSALRRLDLAPLRQRSDADIELQHVIPDRMLRHFVLHGLEHTADGLRWRFNLEGIERSLETLAGFPEQPGHRHYPGATLFVCGARSDYVEARDRWLIKRYFPRAKLANIAGAGHWVHVEQPQRFLDAVNAFLNRDTAFGD